MRSINLQIDPIGVARVLGAAVLLLLLAYGLSLWFEFGLGRPTVYGFVQEFDVDRENNVPTYFSALILLIAGCLAGLIALWQVAQGSVFARHWIALAPLFLFLSVDEAISLHERLIRPIREMLDLSGWLYFSWIVPGIAIVLLIGVLYARLVLNLPLRTRCLVLIAGALYVGGAIGVEMVGGWYATTWVTQSFVYGTIVMVEEGLEMTGVVVVIYAFLDYIRANTIELRLSFGRPDGSGDTSEPGG